MCKCNGTSGRTGIRHHGDKAAALNVKPTQLSDGTHLLVKVRAAAQEGGEYIISLDMILLEYHDGQFVRMCTNKVLAKQPKRQLGKSTPVLMAESEPFKNVSLEIDESEDFDHEDEFGVSRRVREVRLNLKASAKGTHRNIENATASQVVLVPASVLCWYAEYGCHHDDCHSWPCVDYSCNYRCESRICSVNGSGSCGPWKYYSDDCVTCEL